MLHVAGTNGKGSLIAFLRAILRQPATRCIAPYISAPGAIHRACRRRRPGNRRWPVIRNSRRVRSNQCRRADHVLRDHHGRGFLGVRTHARRRDTLGNGPGRASGRHQRRSKRQPVALTPISLDHQSYLGRTIGEVAFEKAGILPGVVCASAAQPTEAARVIRARASLIGAPLFEEGRIGGGARGRRPAHLSRRRGCIACRLPRLRNPSVSKRWLGRRLCLPLGASVRAGADAIGRGYLCNGLRACSALKAAGYRRWFQRAGSCGWTAAIIPPPPRSWRDTSRDGGTGPCISYSVC